MGLSKEEQREKYRQQPKEPIKRGIKRFVGGDIRYLTPRKNNKLNKSRWKPPKIYGGYNTGK